MKVLKKLFVILLKQLDLGSAVAVRLMKITGKSQDPIHPKHFLSQKPWFTKYLNENDLVLDVGCGNGQNTIKTAKMVKKVIGVDANLPLLNIAKQQIKRRRLKNISFEVANLEQKLRYRDNFFDKIIFLDVLEHLIKRDQILIEIKRILKPKGLAFIGVPNSQTSWKVFQKSVDICSYSDPDHKIEYSENQIRKFLKLYNFEIIEFGYGKFDTPFRGLFDIIGSISVTIYKKISKWREKKAKNNPIEASGFEIVAQNIK